MAGLFPFSDYWGVYLAFTVFVALLLGIDLSFHRKAHVVAFREAALWTAAWMALALAFTYGVYLFAQAHAPAAARQVSLEFLAGYIVEWSLSVDNMFVFALVFRYFGVPPQYQHRVLFYGVAGAMVFRAVFIAIGSALVRFEWMMALFGLFLIFTGLRMGFAGEKQVDPGRNPVVRWVRRWMPVTTSLEGKRFLTKVDGVRHFTPLAIVLLVLETTDILFAVDSVPAVFGVTREPLVVYTSNVFAILGLRAMYFLLSTALDRFYALKYGLSAVLVFVGLKMVWLDHAFGGRFPIGISLGIIAGLVGGCIAFSLAFPAGMPRRFLRLAVGTAFLLLAAASLLAAGGMMPLPEALLDREEWLIVSGGCYALCGLALLRARNFPPGRGF